MADLTQIDVQTYLTDCANCGACSACCYLEIAVEYVTSANVSDTFDLYAASADLPGGELLIGRVTDEDAGGDCDPAGIARGVIFLPDSMDGVEPTVPDDTIDLADYDVVYTAALDQLAASGACDVSLKIRAVTNRGCGNASGQLHVYAVCRGPDPVEIDDTIFTGAFASTAGAFPWADTTVVAAFDLCCGVDSPCCQVAGASIKPLLRAGLSGPPLTAGDVGDELVYQSDEISEAGTRPWFWSFSQGGHDYEVEYFCVLFGDGTHTWRYDIYCDRADKEAEFFAAHPSCAGDPEYDADYDFDGDGCVDNADLFLLTETPSLLASGAGGSVTATDCANPGPGHESTITKTITSTEGGCFSATGTLTLEVIEE